MTATVRRRIASRLQGLVLAMLLAPTLGMAADKIALQLKWTHAFQFAGYYAAQAQGYYAQAGLDVDIVEAAPETDVVRRVVQGEANFGVGASSLILDRHAGQPVVVLAAIFQHSPQVIIARRGADLQSIHDLAGKRLMLEKQTEELGAYLKREGIPPASLRLLPHSFNPQEMIDGKVDAMSAYQTNEPFVLDRQGFSYLLLTPRSVGIDFYGDNLFTSERELRDHPQRTQAFVQASLRGWEYALAHPDEIIELIRQRKPAGPSREHLAFEAEQGLPLIRPDLVPIGYMHPGRWRHIANVYAELGMLPADVSLEGFLPEASEAHDWDGYLMPLALALIALVALAGIAFNTHRLNTRLRRSQRELAERGRELLLQNRVLHLLNRGASLPEVLDNLAREVEQQRSGVLCSILLLDPTGRFVRHGAAPSLPDFYIEAIDGLAIGDQVGSCGTAAWRDERVVVEDIRSHPYWQNFTELAERAGLRACWSQPFHGRDGKVIGTFALYHRNPATPSPREIEQIESYARLAELAVERSRSDDALRLAEARYRLISENSNDVIWVLELPALRFSYLSPSVARLRGWTAQEIMDRPMSESLTPESAEKVGQMLRETLAEIAAGTPGPHTRTLEVEQPCRDGSIVPTEVVASVLLDGGGKPAHVLGITRDISERRRNEEELARYRGELERRVDERTRELSEAKEAAETANRAKSTFLATMSHELRTPMNAILGMTDLALRRATDRKQQDQLGKAADAARHLLAIINDILDLSRIEAEKMTLSHADFTIGDMVDGLQRLIEQLAVDKGLHLKFDIAGETRARRVRGDAQRIAQILLNLCGNAIKFTEQGCVTLALTLAEDNGATILRGEVSDTGIGISPTMQQQLFQPFVQADGSLTRQHGGSGLGLAISKRLIELMDGHISLDSEPGRGSRFIFEIRLQAPQSAVAPENAIDHEAEIQRRFAGRRILLAEDEPVNREVFRELLSETGLIVDTAEDGRQAVDMASTGGYSLILMDMQMPNLNGLEATRAIRALPGLAALPIVAMTANAFAEDRQRCLEAGMDDHIGKPVAPDKLFASIHHWLDHRHHAG